MATKQANNLQKTTVAVYGASSNIGGKFVQEALANGATIIAFARDTNKITHLPKRIANEKMRIIQGDITQLKDVRKALLGRNVDTTINFAANFTSNISKSHAVNVIGEQNILKASKEFGVKRHIYISTIATQMLKPNVYRDTKLKAENQVKEAGRKTLDCIILRYANVLGTPTWDQPFKIIIPGIRLAVPKIPTSIKHAAFPYVTIETAIEATIKAISARPNQTITILDGTTTINKYLSEMEKIYNVKKSYLPIRPLRLLDKYLGKYFPPFTALFAVSEFLVHPPAFENETMKRELQIEIRDFQKWIKTKRRLR